MAVPLSRQLVIFSADSARPLLRDLSGLLIGPGEVGRMGGTARVAVRVDEAWRVHALAAEFALRGLSISWEAIESGGFWVRTSYSTMLVRLSVPSYLDGVRLRLWYLSAGSVDEEGFSLGLGKNEALARPALAPLGLDGEVVRGPAIRVLGADRVARLADLIGERPTAAPTSAWPVRPGAPMAARSVPPAGPRRPRPDSAPALPGLSDMAVTPE